jgi:hypothetical protein
MNIEVEEEKQEEEIAPRSQSATICQVAKAEYMSKDFE